MSFSVWNGSTVTRRLGKSPAAANIVGRSRVVLVKARVGETSKDMTLSASASMRRRSFLWSGLSVLTAAQLAWPSVVPGFGAKAAEQGAEEYSRLELEGKLNTQKALENIRAKYNFKRGNDGRIYLKSSKGTYFAVRLDMEVPGTLLFRDSSSGEVFALQTDAFQQIDLSSDQLVILLLGDGEWEREISPITYDGDNGKTKTLTLTETEFRSIVGLLSSVEAGVESK